MPSRPRKRPPEQPHPAKNTSWQPGHKGQGSEGFSKGYGGSEGGGTGASGPEPERPSEDAREKARRERT